MEIQDYYLNWETYYQTKAIFLFNRNGGIGDLLKFFMKSLNFCIKHRIRLFIDSNDDPIRDYIRLRFNKMYIDSSKIQNKQFIRSLDELLSKSSNYKLITPSAMYSGHQMNIRCHTYLDLEKINDVFYFTEEVKAHSQVITNNIKDYVSIHIRLGDKKMSEENESKLTNDTRFIVEEKIENCIKKYENSNIPVFLCCDNNAFKQKFKLKFDFINIAQTKIGHTGLMTTSKSQHLDAVSEFYILSNSKKIYMGTYSGFSIVASKFNNVPIECLY